MIRKTIWTRCALAPLLWLAQCHSTGPTPGSGTVGTTGSGGNGAVGTTGSDGGSAAGWSAHDYARCQSPSAFTAGDFDGDGHGDLLLSCANGLALRRSDGHGGFAVETMIALSDLPGALASADLDGDGMLDVAVLLPERAQLQLLRGDGHGAFAAGRTVATGAGPRDVVITDVDGDQRPDLITADREGQDLTVWLAGPGRSVTVPLDVAPEQLAVGDLSGDGKLDVVAVSRVDGRVRYLRGGGDGSFSADDRVDAGAILPQAALIGDFDNDHALDLVVTGLQLHPTSPYGSAWGDGTITAWLNDGQGGLQPPIQTASFPAGSALVATDFDGDGWLDLQFVNDAATDFELPIVRGDGHGSFGDGNYGTLSTPLDDSTALRLVDFDGSGALATVLVSDSGLTWVSPVAGPKPTWLGGATYDHAAIGDLDGDGHADVVLSSRGSSSATVYHGDGAGGLDRPRELMLSYYLNGSPPAPLVQLANFEGTGRADLVDLYVPSFWRDGDATLTPLPALAAPLSAIGDFDGDGRADLLTLSVNQLRLVPGHSDSVLGASLFLATLPLPIGYPYQAPQALATGDFDGDGKLDAVALAQVYDSTAPAQSALYVVLGPGDTSELGRALPSQPIVGAQQIVPGDFDGDGKLDLLLRTTAAQTQLLVGQGDGTFVAAAGFVGWAADFDLVSADFDGDGNLDVASTHDRAAGRTLELRRGNGDGSFTLVRGGAGPRDLVPLAAGDLDGDRRPELLGLRGADLTVLSAKALLP